MLHPRAGRPIINVLKSFDLIPVSYTEFILAVVLTNCANTKVPCRINGTQRNRLFWSTLENDKKKGQTVSTTPSSSLCLSSPLQWTSTLRFPCVSPRPPSQWTYAWTITSNSSSSRCPRCPRPVSSRPARARPAGWGPRSASSSCSRSCWPWSRSSRSSGRSSSPSSSGSTSSCPGSTRPSCRNTLRYANLHICRVTGVIPFYVTTI